MSKSSKIRSNYCEKRSSLEKSSWSLQNLHFSPSRIRHSEKLWRGAGQRVSCYYSKRLATVDVNRSPRNAIQILGQNGVAVDRTRIESWVTRYCEKHQINLSDEQSAAVCGIAGHSFSVLTGGPGCGKTTTTKVLVALLKAMKSKVLLAAPTGRAAQRMTEVIGVEAKTIHRLLEWSPQGKWF